VVVKEVLLLAIGINRFAFTVTAENGLLRRRRVIILFNQNDRSSGGAIAICGKCG